MQKKQDIEIMSPAGSFESLQAAIQAGAGSVYFGVGELNMRAQSSVNFSIDDLAEIVVICKEHKVKSYLALNTIVYDDELEEMKQMVDLALDKGVTAIIASDMSVISYAAEKGVEVHISTQLNISNIESLRFYARFADVIVLARELTLEQVRQITDAIREEQIKGPSGHLVRLEMFVHGALCMAISGKCYLSLHESGHAANRGRCLQTCRKAYVVKEKEHGLEWEVDNEYIMSPKDLSTIHFLNKILDAGVSVLKIEGRARPPEYVKIVTECYREAIDAINEGTYTSDKIEAWYDRLETVFNRGFWDGYYMGKKLGEWSHVYGSQATQTKEYLGKVTNYFSRLGVAEIIMQSGTLHVGDAIYIIGTTTGVLKEIVSEIRVNQQQVKKTSKGDVCSIPVSELVRRSDKTYLIKKVGSPPIS
jgi:U32 family peptidase